jgi:hypothetical protein
VRRLSLPPFHFQPLFVTTPDEVNVRAPRTNDYVWKQ